MTTTNVNIRDFVDRRSIVRTIWGDPDLVLLINPALPPDMRRVGARIGNLRMHQSGSAAGCEAGLRPAGPFTTLEGALPRRPSRNVEVEFS
ncbi:MAG TPA: hypothetical protein VFR78_15840 [Pyrinomonadaceae bacterium]|nr:hypothetical protein [Pyrinomonadaceae bacterium]